MSSLPLEDILGNLRLLYLLTVQLLLSNNIHKQE